MKKNLFMVAAVALLATVSCNKMEENHGGDTLKPSYYVEFTADAPNEGVEPAQASAQTKTTYDDTNKKTLWSEDDVISVNGKKFVVKTVLNDGLSAIFINDDELGENFTAPYTAIYPYNATSGVANVPEVQTVTDGTFAEESVVAVAYSSSANELSFKHVTSVVKFTVATEGVTELEFSSSVDLAGTINVAANEGGDPTYTSQTGSKTITVRPASGTFSTDETYYVSVLPTIGTESKYFAIKSEGVTVKSGNVVFKRNTVMDAKSITVNYAYMKPSLVWNISSPRYAAYMYGTVDGEKIETWVNMSDTDKDGVYRAVVPEGGYTTIIYCRMDPSKTDNIWDNKWNQTSDLTLADAKNNAYIIKYLTWDKGVGSYKSISEAAAYIEPVIYLKPNSNWKKENARFAIYLCNGTKPAKWISLSYVDGNYYAVEQPSDFTTANYKNIIFCRMKPSPTANNWDNKWNQSGDLPTSKIITDQFKCCAINSGQWDCGTAVTWSKVLQ